MQIRFRTVDSVTVADSGYFTKGHNEYVTKITTETPGVPSLFAQGQNKGVRLRIRINGRSGTAGREVSRDLYATTLSRYPEIPSLPQPPLILLLDKVVSLLLPLYSSCDPEFDFDQ